CSKEELLHACFAVRQAIAQKSDVTFELIKRLNGVMRFLVQPVVDTKVCLRAKTHISIPNLRPAAIGEYGVTFRDRRVKRISRICLQSPDCRRRVYIPKAHCAATAAFQDALFE